MESIEYVDINIEEALKLYELPLVELTNIANRIRESHMGYQFDFCSIANAKNGACSENCKFCAQSFQAVGIEEPRFASFERLVEEAEICYSSGVKRFSLVTSGKHLSDDEVKMMADYIRRIKARIPKLKLCASFGLLNASQFQILKESGLERIHNNLETGPEFFKNICTSHTYEDKIDSIKDAQSVGLEVCSGILIGMGETMRDRLEAAADLRKLGIKSVPINFFNPIKGTPFGEIKTIDEEEMLRTVALFRIFLPNAYIRLAGGRNLLKEGGRFCFQAGANATITGDLLTTIGVSLQYDKEMIQSMGYKMD